MSKPLTFLQKLKLFRLYLKNHKNGVIVDCGICGSTNITFDNQSTEKVVTPKIEPKEIHFSIVYLSQYTCQDCGAKCMNRQEWYEPQQKQRTGN